MTTLPRAQQIADAWVSALNSADFGSALNAERVYEVKDKLPDRVTKAVHVIGKSDRGTPLSKKSWQHLVEVATALRVRTGATNAERDALGLLAEQIGDYARACRPLCWINGKPVTLESTVQTLWLPADLEKYGLYDSVVIHTWRVEVVNPELTAVSSESSVEG